MRFCNGQPFYMRFCYGIDKNFQHHFVIIKITVGMKTSQHHHETCPMVLESRWNGVETNAIAIGGLDGFNTIGMVLKILMRQKMFLDEKRHNYLIMVQELILKVAKKNE